MRRSRALEPLDLAAPAVTGGEYQDRIVAARGAQLTDQLYTVHAWQAQVDDRGVEGILTGYEQPVLAVGGRVDRIASRGEHVRQLAAQRGVVLNDQDAHGPCLCLALCRARTG